MDTNQLKFLMYRAAEGDVSVNAVIRDETIWLTQKAMAELFGECPCNHKMISPLCAGTGKGAGVFIFH